MLGNAGVRFESSFWNEDERLRGKLHNEQCRIYCLVCINLGMFMGFRGGVFTWTEQKFAEVMKQKVVN